MYYYYSNPSCQGAVICETNGCPEKGRTAAYDTHSAYSDRLYDWDKERYNRVRDLIGGGDQVWAYKLPELSQSKWREIAKEAFDLDRLPDHVRFVFYYNVSSGYACPVIIAFLRNTAPQEIAEAAEQQPTNAKSSASLQPTAH